MKEQQLNELLKGYKITSLRRTLDLIMFEFEFLGKQPLFLHAECFVQIATGNKVLLSTYDLYEPKPNLTKGKYELDDYGATLFDYSLEKNLSQIVGHEIISVSFRCCGLEFCLTDGLMIRIIPNTTEKNREQLILSDDDVTYLWLWTDENDPGKIIDIS